MSSATTGKKRQYHDNRSGGGGGGAKKYQNHVNPKRGGPGILFTSETGREYKCQVEGIDILQHYLQQQQQKDEGTIATETTAPSAEEVKQKEKEVTEGPSMNLEDELMALKESNEEKKIHQQRDFAVYETGCRGTVFVLCTLPGCHMIPPIQVEKNSKKEKGSKDEDGSTVAKPDAGKGDGKVAPSEDVETVLPGDEEIVPKPPDAKKQRVELEEEKIAKNDAKFKQGDIRWDPVETVRNVISDLRQGKRDMPSSRFVTRMVPIQATCFASEPDMLATARGLIDRYAVPTAAKTFAIAIKRRNCSNIKRDTTIDGIAKLMQAALPECKVNLENPELTIVVEICKTLCGMAVVANCKELDNFNIIVAREGKAEKQQGGNAAKKSK